MQQATASAKANRFEIRFLLTEAELKEGAAVRKTFMNSIFGKTFARVITGVGTLFFGFYPYIRGTTWPGLFATDPIKAVLIAALAVWDLWITIGSPGVAKLNRGVNRLDLERHIIIEDAGVDVTHGANRYQSKWQDFRHFQETPNLFVLLTTFERFWTIPKRTLPAGSIDQLRSFLQSKLPQK